MGTYSESLSKGICRASWLAPSPQEKLSICSNVLFFVILLLNLLYSYFRGRGLDLDPPTQQGRRRLRNGRNNKTSSCFGPSIPTTGRIASTILAASAFSIAVFWKIFFVHDAEESSQETFDVEKVFFLAQTLTWLTFLAISVMERRHVLIHGILIIRIWWATVFLLASVQFASSLLQYIKNCPDPIKPQIGDMAWAFVNFVSSLALIVTTSMHSEEEDDGELNEPLLGNGSEAKPQQRAGDYAHATFLSKLTWQWLNPILEKGYTKRLELEDVPNLPSEIDAQNLYTRFLSDWRNTTGGDPNRLRRTIFWCFRWQFLHTGALALCRASVMYIGPSLISTFVLFKTIRHERKHGVEAWQGYVLVLILAISKCVDVLASHHFNFACQNLGMAIRSTLITLVYRKGIRLATSARLTHGLGQIVNYMSVDVQQIADVVIQLHNLWLLPLQTCIALTILYSVVGISSGAGLATMVILVTFSTWSSSRQRKFQAQVMKARDSRMKATSESLNAMKVIKLQAWEEQFRHRIETLREVEYGWLIKFMYQIASSTAFIWCSPTIVSVATFACCIYLGADLSPGKVFTATATFRILQEPIRNLPNLLISLNQAMVSLDRLEKYLGSQELDAAAVVSSTSAADSAAAGGGEEADAQNEYNLPPAVAVQIDDASFSWESSTHVGGGGGGFPRYSSNGKGSVTSIGEGNNNANGNVTSIGKGNGNANGSGNVTSIGEVNNNAKSSGNANGNVIGSGNGEEVKEVVTLSHIALRVMKGSLVAVVGSVGSGKSSLLACMLGEMPKLHGKVHVCGTTAYVPQTAWIQSGTIEDNILFGQPMDHERYAETIRACALERDIELMEHSDQTEIGERGINLSGGQKQRIQLARAVYQDSDIYLLDDVFSAVDAHTGSAIFKDCVKGVLKNKTIILVTHQVDFLHGADLIVVMRDGMVTQSGRYDEVLKEGTDFDALVSAHNESMELVETEEILDHLAPQSLQRLPSLKEDVDSMNDQKSNSRPNRFNVTAKKGTAKLIEDEQREVGRVSWSVYWLYVTKAYGPGCVVLALFVQAVWLSVTLSSDYWLAYETSDAREGGFNPHTLIRVYAALCLGVIFCTMMRGFIIISVGVKTTQIFYLEMLQQVFRAPMSFFDTTPSGRILSRSSSDQSSMDVLLPFFFGSCLATYFSLLGVLFVLCQTAWPITFVLLPLGYVYLQYQAYFIASSRELTRLDSITKAPIIHHFSESMAGFMVIRCFKKGHQFSQANVDRVNQNVRMVFHNNAANEWLGYRLEMIGTIILCSLALLLVVLPDRYSPPQLVGLALSYGLSLNQALFWAVWLACNLENKMVAVERIQQFINIPSEAPSIISNHRPAANWPSMGTIEFQNLQLRYRPTTPMVLKGITLTISGGEKVGVVGRTGSGKSTLIQALFRLVEPSGGRIVIDGVDIVTLGLSDLRSKFGIIPQEPTLFEGTVRANVDPLQQYADDQIWECLEACQLADVIRSKAGKLDAPVADDGDNWSVGQKQLFCLGRALLKHAKILVLDEATASVDAHTDGLIQKTVREAFANSTVISIAHRIPTVMDSNKVLVLDAGRVKEYDKPSRLLDDPSSLFASLVKEYTRRSHHDGGIEHF